jgi:ADP-ribose pyrophosphatase
VTFRIVESKILGSGRIVDLCDVTLEAPDGETAHRDVVRHPGGVGVLPIVDSDVLVLRQYRVAVGREILEIPAGKLDSPDERPAVAAERELREEMGLVPLELIDLGNFMPSPGYTDELIHLYAATGVGDARREPDGMEERYAEVVRIPIAEFSEMIDKGEVPDAKTQIAMIRWLKRTT